MATGIRSNGYTEYPLNPTNSVGKTLRTVFYDKTIATGAGANTLHILAGPLTGDTRIAAIKGAVPALTSANNNDLGFWKMNADGTFTAVDQDIIWDGIDLSSAVAYRELLSNFNTSLDRDDSINTLLGKASDQEPAGGYYLGLYIQTASTAASEDLHWEILLDPATNK